MTTKDDKTYNAGDKFTTMYGEILRPPCLTCKHFNLPNVLVCLAFPKGIPRDIMDGKNDHTKPVEGDDGIVYELNDGLLAKGDNP